MAAMFAIIGAGDIGATTALTLPAASAREHHASSTAAEPLPPARRSTSCNRGPISGVDVQFRGADVTAAAAGAAVVAIADCAGADGEWRGDAAPFTWVRQLSGDRFRGARRVRGRARSRFAGARPSRSRAPIGGASLAAPRARSSRTARAMAAVGAGCSADDVALAVAGFPGSCARTECTVSGAPIDRLDARTCAGSEPVIGAPRRCTRSTRESRSRDSHHCQRHVVRGTIGAHGDHCARGETSAPGALPMRRRRGTRSSRCATASRSRCARPRRRAAPPERSVGGGAPVRARRPPRHSPSVPARSRNHDDGRARGRGDVRGARYADVAARYRAGLQHVERLAGRHRAAGVDEPDLPAHSRRAASAR